MYLGSEATVKKSRRRANKQRTNEWTIPRLLGLAVGDDGHGGGADVLHVGVPLVEGVTVGVDLHAGEDGEVGLGGVDGGADELGEILLDARSVHSLTHSCIWSNGPFIDPCIGPFDHSFVHSLTRVLSLNEKKFNDA